MKEFKGTRWKWNVSKVPEYNDVLKSEMIEIQYDNVWICKVQNNGVIENKEGQYNALLISKAPEMLEMLQYLNRRGGLGLDIHNKIEQLIKQSTEL